jgi:hypothetical protein
MVGSQAALLVFKAELPHATAQTAPVPPPASASLKVPSRHNSRRRCRCKRHDYRRDGTHRHTRATRRDIPCPNLTAGTASRHGRARRLRNHHPVRPRVSHERAASSRLTCRSWVRRHDRRGRRDDCNFGGRDAGAGRSHRSRNWISSSRARVSGAIGSRRSFQPGGVASKATARSGRYSWGRRRFQIRRRVSRRCRARRRLTSVTVLPNPYAVEHTGSRRTGRHPVTPCPRRVEAARESFRPSFRSTSDGGFRIDGFSPRAEIGAAGQGSVYLA